MTNDLAAIPSLVVDGLGVIIEVDRAVIETLMIPAGDLVGHPFVDHVGPPDRRRVKECIESCVGLRLHAITEVQMVRGDGSPLLAQLASYPKWQGAANVIGCRIQLHDVSALKRAQARLSLLANASAILGGSMIRRLPLDQIAALVVPTLADACLIDVGVGTASLRRAAAFIGEELPGLAASTSGEGSIVSKESPQGQVMTTGQPLVHPPAPHNLVCLPMRAENQTYGVLTLIAQQERPFAQADLDAALDLGARIAQAMQNSGAHERLQRALRERNDVLAFVSHDLRNLLAALFLDAEGMLRAAPIPERRRGWTRLDRILRGLRSLRRMVDDLPEVSASEAGPGMTRASSAIRVQSSGTGLRHS